jgi:hypothetical protein
VHVSYRLLAHAKVESAKLKEAAEQRRLKRRSWLSFRWYVGTVVLLPFLGNKLCCPLIVSLVMCFFPISCSPFALLKLLIVACVLLCMEIHFSFLYISGVHTLRMNLLGILLRNHS